MSGPRFDPPPGWVLLDVPGDADSVALIAAAPQRPQPSFRPNLVLAYGTEAPDFADVDEFAEAAIEDQADTLSDFLVLDRERTELAGLPCIRTLAHYDADSWSVVADQWRLLGPSGGIELTASCRTLEFAELAPIVAASAATLRVESK